CPSRSSQSATSLTLRPQRWPNCRSVNGLAAAATALSPRRTAMLLQHAADSGSDADYLDGGSVATAAALPELSESERQQILLSDNFQAFLFARPAGFVERALAETEAEYFETDGEADAGSDAYDEGAVAGAPACAWSRGRCVTALDWSPHYQELCLAAYAESQQSHPGGDSDGVVCVWERRYRWPIVLSSRSTASHTVTGWPTHRWGTYSGQLVLWDTRTHRRTPVQRSTLGAQGHTEPCVFTRVLGTERAANFLRHTCPSDARLLSPGRWSRLLSPVETLRSHAVGCRGTPSGAWRPPVWTCWTATALWPATEDAMLCVGCPARRPGPGS
uniref:WD_REPEATS_REGION domain-containing protein n=1 Tax=Macrostomum lignano TaxID=282301 RepID=A0A1I8IJQ5_9PLAT